MSYGDHILASGRGGVGLFRSHPTVEHGDTSVSAEHAI